MKTRADSGRVLTDELGRVLEQFHRVEEHAEKVLAERKRSVHVAHDLLLLLRGLVGEQAATKLIEGYGLGRLVARLPGVARPKPATKAQDTRGKSPRAPAPGRRATRKPLTEAPSTPVSRGAPAVLGKGIRIQMLTGKYHGWTGVVRWIQAAGSMVAYTVDLVGPDGASARNQVRHVGLGKTWAIAVDAPSPKPSVRRQTRGTATPVATPLLPKGTEVRIFTGKYESATGVIGYTATKGSTVNYTVSFVTKSGTRGRTQVSHGSRGKAWEVVSDLVPLVELSTEAIVPVVPVVAAKPVFPKPSTPEAAAPVKVPVFAAPAAPLPPGVLPEGTPIKMMAGHYLGCSGIVTSVHLTSPGPRPDAIYMLALTMPDGSKVRLSSRQSSLGRTWAKAA